MDAAPTADRLAAALVARDGRPLALLGPQGRGKPWLAMQVAGLCGLRPVKVDARLLNDEPVQQVRRRLAALPRRSCVVVNFIDAASPELLSVLRDTARRVAVVGCGPSLPDAAGEAWTAVRSTPEWIPLFLRDEPPILGAPPLRDVGLG